MATLYFLKEGKKRNGDRLTRAKEIKIDEAVRVFGTREHRHATKPFTINPEIVADECADYRFVILEVSEAELRAPFDKGGYYWLIGLSPAGCEEQLGLDAGPLS